MIITDLVHLTSTVGEDELHAFAETIGLRREWYQRKRRPHYDLTTPRARRRALDAGARFISSRQLVIDSWWSRYKKAGGK